MNNKLWIAGAVSVLALLAGCKNSGSAQNSTDMRALNAVVDAEPLDVLVDSDVKVSGLAYGATSSYSEFGSGTRAVAIRSSTTQSILSDKSLSFASGANSTLFMYGKRNALLSQLIADDTTAPSSGHFRVRVVNLSPDTGAVDLYLTTDTVTTGAAAIAGTAFGVATASAEVTTGSLRITFNVSGTQEVLFQSAPFAFSDGSSVSIAIVPSLGGKLANAIVLGSGRTGTATLLQNPFARLKAVNAIADSTGLNFKVNGTTLLSAVPYTGSSSYVTTASGSRTLQIEASNVPGTIIASTTKTLDPARDYTALAVGSIAAPQLVAITDDNSLPPSGLVKLRFVQAVAGVTAVDALVNFANQASGIGYAQASSYYQLAPGTTYTITFATPGGVTVLATLTPVELDAGGVYTAYLFGSAGNIQAKLVRDR